MTYVALMRLPTTEIYLARNFLDVVAARGLAYKLAETPDQIAKADVVIIDADNQISLSLWNTLRKERPTTTAILISKAASVDDGRIWIQRPLNSMKMLTALGKADLRRNPDGNPNRSKSPVVSGHLQGTRVLVIDDSATVRKQLELSLADQGVQVFTADSGEAGLHMLSQNNIDLVFLDVMLPGADGYQICKTIKKNRQKNTVPVVMLTSKSSPFDRVKGSLAGCDSYLTKPVEFRRLIEVLDKFRVRRTEIAGKSGITMVPGGSTARAL